MQWTVLGQNPGGSKIYCICPRWPQSPPVLLYNGYLCSLPGVKLVRHMIGHTPPFSVEVEKEYS